ncbi:MAG: hypothetical protein GY711_13770 [bacterium]|nr:hypothetical protein [bacterium]
MNVIERAVILSTADRLHIDLEPTPQVASALAATDDEPVIRTDAEMRALERANLIAALEESSWKVSGKDGAAELLGIRPTTLTSRMKSMGIART